MPQGGLKAVKKQAKESVEKPRGGVKKAPKKGNAAKHAAKVKVSKLINNNIEQVMIEKMNREKPGALHIIKERQVRPGDSIERRKKLEKEARKIPENKKK
eukprot:TRINITY_DN2409_c0_g1_i2.p2 TRINITY_DN2409_c0_g1~~TRINITY_DN2409_c0_g1_i2.p2  ORF type:complete len:100 (+),score=38.75 TRINITY_DN2409_c0_g1_i2:15-314(+)